MSSRKATRVAALADVLLQRRVLHIRDAARITGVSEMTIRRDISENPNHFAFFGGHIVPVADIENTPYELATAADSHAAAKRGACMHAARLIREEDTVFFDCGTTLPYLIDLIPTNCHITAVCYALNTAERLARKPNVRLVVLGGLFHPASATFFGSSGLDTLNSLGINLAFLSAAGVDFERGATCAHFHEAEVKRKVISLARKNVLVIDSSKIGKLRPAFFGDLQAFDAIITETGETSLAPDPASSADL